MIKVEVEPGNCGHATMVKVFPKDNMKVEVLLESECQYIDSMAEELKEVDAYNECFHNNDHSKVLAVARKHCKHAGCPVPMAIIKGIEVAMGVNPARDVKVHIEDDQKTC
ncbi:MAG: DUF6951 family protein [Candidatus Cyclobacteriaceae bacterium M3_2C_046]